MNEEYKINEILLAVNELNKIDKNKITLVTKQENVSINKEKIPQETINIIKQAENYINKK